MQPHQQRVIAEKSELDERLSKLIAFFDDAKFSGLPTDEQDRMKRQAEHMTHYSVVLGERIAAFPETVEPQIPEVDHHPV